MGGKDRRKAADFIILALASVGAPYVLLQAAGTTLFLLHHGGAALPYVYLCVAIFSALIAWGFTRFAERFELLRLVVALTVGRAVIAALLKLGLATGFASEASFAAAVWARLDIVLGGLALWALFRQNFADLEARRWRVLLIACEPTAIMVMGLAAPLMLDFIAVDDLLLAAGLLPVAAIAPMVFSATISDAERGRRPERVHREVARVRRALSPTMTRYLAMIFGVIGVWTFAHYLLDVLFYASAGARYTDAVALTSFISYALAASGMVSVALMSFGSPRLMMRYGVRGGLLGLPLLMAALAGVALGLWYGAHALGYVFIAITVTKVVERAVLSTMYRPAFQTLFQPLPDTHRDRVIARAESSAQPVATGVAALLLIAVVESLGVNLVTLAQLLLVAAVVWMGLVLVLHRGYVAALARALSRRQSFDFLAPGAADQKSRLIIQRMIHSGQTRNIVGAARIQAALDPDGFRNAAPQLIATSDAAVAKQLLTTVKEIEQPEFYPAMSGRLTVEEDEALRDALLTAAAATRHRNSPRLLARALAEEPDDPPLGALIGLGRHGGDYGAAIAAQFLERHALAGEKALAQTLEAIAKIGERAPTGPVAMGLNSRRRRIRKMAIRAAGRVKSGALAPLLIERLRDVRERRAAQMALSAIGAPAIDALAQAAGDRKGLVPVRAAALMALGGIDEPKARTHLFHHIAAPRPELAATAHLALWRAGVVAPREHAEALLVSARISMRHAAEATMARAALIDIEGGAFDAALALLIQRLIARAVRAAGLTRRRPENAGGDLSALFGDSRDREAARTLARTLLPAEFRPGLAAIQTGDAARLAGFVEIADRDWSDWLGYILTEAPWASDWLRALALMRLGADNPDNTDDLIELVEDPGPITTDTIRALRAPKGVTKMALSTIEKVLILKSADLFAQAPEEDLAEIAPFLASIYLDPDEPLIREGEIGDELYIVVSGKLKVERKDAEVTEIGEGGVVGDLAALDPEPRMATVTAVGPAHVLALSNDHLLALFESNAELSAGVIQSLVRRLRATDRY